MIEIEINTLVMLIISGFCTGLGSGIANYFVFKLLLKESGKIGFGKSKVQ